MAEEKGKGGGAATVPPTVCTSCKAPNEMGALTCKRCGDILSKKGKVGKKGDAEFDPTTGSFSPSCVVIPVVLIIVAILFLFLATRGCKGQTQCDHNREIIGRAIMKFEKAHSGDKLSSLDYTKLAQPDSKGKPYLKEKPVCPFDSGASYEYDGNIVTCTKCTKKK